MAGVDLQGFDGLLRGLKKVSSAKAMRELKKETLTPAAEPIRAEAARAMPQDQGVVAAAVKIRRGKPAGPGDYNVIVGVFSQRKHPRETGDPIATVAQVAARLEVGTAHTPAVPTLQHALDTKSTAATRIIGPLLGRNIESKLKKQSRG